MAEWYYAKNDQQQGPYTLEQLNALAKAGQFNPDNLVWTDSMEDWAPASEVGEIEFQQASAKPPPALPSHKAAAVPAPTLQQYLDSLSKAPPVVWSLLMIAGAGLLFIAFILPWWGIDIEHDEDASRKERETASEVQAQNAFWYFQHVRPVSKIEDSDGATLWGWNTGAGITGLICALLVLPIAVLPLCIRELQPWSWIGRFVILIPGCVMLIMFAIWFFGAPSKNVSPILYQGLYLGPYVVFLAAGMLLIAGGVGGTLGLIEFVSRLKSGAPGRVAAPTDAAVESSDDGLEMV